VAMPKATMYENNSVVPFQHHIRRTG